MTPLALLLAAVPQTTTVDAPTLEYYQDHFVVRRGNDTWRAMLHPTPPEPRLAVAFRRNDNYAVWDERGLTVRRGTTSKSTLLPDLPTAPKAFSREEILATIEKLNDGTRRRPAAGLSGALRLGTDTYFLVRWEEKDGRPWTEALYRVELDSKGMHPQLVGRFDGLSVAFRPIDDRLFRVEDRLAVVTRRADDWGLATFDTKRKSFDFRPFGGKLNSILAVNRLTGLFVETTTYGTTVGGLVDFENNQRHDRFEARGNARFIDEQRPLVVMANRGGAGRMRNATSGADVIVPAGSGVQRAGPYIVTFTPAEEPTKATLYDPDRWTVLAQWSKPPAN